MKKVEVVAPLFISKNNFLSSDDLPYEGHLNIVG